MVYLALSLCGMEDVEAMPQQQLHSRDELLVFFKDLCDRVVRHIWQMPSANEVTAIVDCPTDSSFVTDSWCICGEGMHVLPLLCWHSVIHCVVVVSLAAEWMPVLSSCTSVIMEHTEKKVTSCLL